MPSRVRRRRPACRARSPRRVCAHGAELALLVPQGAARAGYRARGLDRTLTDTIDWYRELIDSGAFGGGRPSALSLAAAGMRVADRTGALGFPAGRRALRGPEDGGAVTASPGLFPRDEYYMRLALREAERALDHDDVPIGAVVVHEGEVIAAARNERELRRDPTAHAEILALARPPPGWTAGGCSTRCCT